jgi:hypothetical protein
MTPYGRNAEINHLYLQSEFAHSQTIIQIGQLRNAPERHYYPNDRNGGNTYTETTTVQISGHHCR